MTENLTKTKCQTACVRHAAECLRADCEHYVKCHTVNDVVNGLVIHSSEWQQIAVQTGLSKGIVKTYDPNFSFFIAFSEKKLKNPEFRLRITSENCL